MTSSLRACLAAESWKRLYPDGAPTGAAGHKKDKNIRLTFEDFAKQSFKVSETYAKQALAILNYSPDLLEDAKQDLTGTYKTYQGRVAEDRVKNGEQAHITRYRQAAEVAESINCNGAINVYLDKAAHLAAIHKHPLRPKHPRTIQAPQKARKWAKRGDERTPRPPLP
jgi:hypothetical protein